MGPLFAVFTAVVCLASLAVGGISNSYLPAKSGGPAWSGPLAVPTVLSDGTIAETAEVAAARAAHLAALEAARALDPDMGHDDGEYNPQKYGDHVYGVVGHSEDLRQSLLSYQALAKGMYGAPGSGMQSLAKTMAHASAGGAMYGAPAPGPVYGTPESGMQNLAKTMAHASAIGAMYGVPDSGMQSLAKTMAHASAGGAMYGAPAPGPVYGTPSQDGQAEQNKAYSGPLAMLQLLASGFLADTPEVIAARNTHLKALQEAQAAADLWRAKQSAAGNSAQAHPWG